VETAGQITDLASPREIRVLTAVSRHRRPGHTTVVAKRSPPQSIQIFVGKIGTIGLHRFSPSALLAAVRARSHLLMDRVIASVCLSV